MELSNKIPKWLIAVGCWLLSLSWPIFVAYFTVRVSFLDDFLLEAFYFLGRFGDMLGIIIFLSLCFLPSFYFISRVPYSRKIKLLNGCFLLILITIFILLSYAETQ